MHTVSVNPSLPLDVLIGIFKKGICKSHWFSGILQQKYFLEKGCQFIVI